MKWPVPGMGKFLGQARGHAFVATFPYIAHMERGASLAETEERRLALAPATFSQFAESALQAVKLPGNQAMWIPYGGQP